MNDTILRERLLAAVGGVFAILALLLAAIGIFGLLNYSVRRRTRDLGVRAALGAQRGELVALVVRETAAMIIGGLAAGVAISLAAMKFFESLLFGVRPAEPSVVMTAIILFLVTSLIAAALPARRAASIDPLIALRSE